MRNPTQLSDRALEGQIQSATKKLNADPSDANVAAYRAELVAEFRARQEKYAARGQAVNPLPAEVEAPAPAPEEEPPAPQE